jgi:ribonucleotide monophosphatase NagD (HAD superfamily)
LAQPPFIAVPVPSQESEQSKSIYLIVVLQDVRDDVGGAQNSGMLGILVRTGMTNIGLNLFILLI